MQNRETGTLEPLENLEQSTKDKAVPRKYQGPVFTLGEIVDVKGGKFRVCKIKRSRLVLKGVPS